MKKKYIHKCEWIHVFIEQNRKASWAIGVLKSYKNKYKEIWIQIYNFLGNLLLIHLFCSLFRLPLLFWGLFKSVVISNQKLVWRMTYCHEILHLFLFYVSRDIALLIQESCNAHRWIIIKSWLVLFFLYWKSIVSTDDVFSEIETCVVTKETTNVHVIVCHLLYAITAYIAIGFKTYRNALKIIFIQKFMAFLKQYLKTYLRWSFD